MNEKRNFVLSYMKRQQIINIKEAANFAGVSQALARGVRQQMMFGQSVTFEYPNMKEETDIAALRKNISKIDEYYYTVSDLKRSHGSFSRKWILRELKKQGYKWRKMPRNSLKPKEQPNAKKVCQVITHMAQAHNCSDVEVLFLDEMHFPLYQTSDRH